MNNSLKKHPAYIYAKDVVDGKFISNKEIILVCKHFLEDLEKSENDPNFKYIFDYDLLNVVTDMTKLINMADGIKIGQPVYSSLVGFQWFFIINILCWKHKHNIEKRRYESAILLIGRKSGKTFLVALIFILLLTLEPKYSEFYSVAPDRELSSIVKNEMKKQISSSPAISKHFKITNKNILCIPNQSKFEALATSNNRMDGRKANVFVADEVGALKNRYPIDAMMSSQMNMVNRAGILISTAYESLNNPMTEEVNYAEKVINGIIENDQLFALIYRPDDSRKWMDEDEIKKANPLAVDIQENFDYLIKQRDMAIEIPSKQKNFKTKHMNIFVDGDDSEVYIKTEDLIKNKLEKPYDWERKEVYVGVDLSLSTDNTGVSMVHYDEDEDTFYIKAWGFLPLNSLDEKSKIEKVDYRIMIENGYAFANGDRVVSYKDIEDFVLSLEEEYGVIIKAIAYDKWNAISSVNRWSDEGLETIEIQQHSRVLHKPTKLLKEHILQQKAKYEKNKLLELNFSNAREVFDTNLNSYINKRKSNGKIDMVAATLNAVALWNNDIEEGLSSYEDRGLYIL